MESDAKLKPHPKRQFLEGGDAASTLFNQGKLSLSTTPSSSYEGTTICRHLYTASGVARCKRLRPLAGSRRRQQGTRQRGLCVSGSIFGAAKTGKYSAGSGSSHIGIPSVTARQFQDKS
ncbi:hypothetical protein J6590_014885 [Homalodisca vitripennis]|nr:hypothetical protein J6590_014885 [Homalodisca vitripennis]